MWNTCKTLTFIVATYVGVLFTSEDVFAHSLPDLPPELSSEDYSLSQERSSLDKIGNYDGHRSIFSSGTNIFDKAHPHVEDLEENRVAFELQKRVSRLVDESQRRRRQDLLERLPKIIFSNTDGIPKYYRVPSYPWVMRSSKGFSAEKRPLNKKYYAEPEGSEFLGGPGK